MNPPSFDIEAAHHYFSAYCFNLAWDFIDKPERTPQEEVEMLSLSQASLWHWTQRPDCTPTNMSIAYWQLARIYALLNKPAESRSYGSLCLDISQTEGVEPFYRAYAYEALARAEATACNPEQMEANLRQARTLAEQIADPQDRKQLLKDLDTIH